MGWIARLYRRLTSAWSTDPLPTPAFTLACDGTDLAWQVLDGVLTLTPTGGTATAHSIALAAYPTVLALAGTIGALPGYSVANLAGPPIRALSPLALVDATGNTNNLNGGNLHVATSPQYLILGAAAGELAAAETQIPNLPLMMSTTTAVGSWLDYLGGFFAVPRANGEGDKPYAVRIIQQTILPKCNDVSMARALTEYTGKSAQVTTVSNYTGVNYCNGVYDANGAITCGSGLSGVQGGLFDVEVGYDIISTDLPTNFTQVVTSYINSLKAAGTALRNLTIAPLSSLSDASPVPNDAINMLGLTYSYTCNGQLLANGQAPCASGLTLTTNLAGPGAW